MGLLWLMSKIFCSVGNICGNPVAAGVLLFADWQVRNSHNKDAIAGKKILLSHDMQVMLVIGAWLRLYWGTSSPAVWEVPNKFAGGLACIDVFTAPFLWMLVWWRLRSYDVGSPKLPIYVQWPFLLFVSVVSGLCWQHYGPFEFYEDKGFRNAQDVSAVSHVLDGLAFVPQIFALSKGVEGSAGDLHPCVGHFVGLLTMGRFFRMLSWFIHIVFLVQLLSGDVPGRRVRTSVVEQIILYGVPDVFHTILMGDYFYVWCKKVKEQALDHWSAQINSMMI